MQICGLHSFIVLNTFSHILFFRWRPCAVLIQKCPSEWSCACIDRQPDLIMMQLCATSQSHEGPQDPDTYLSSMQPVNATLFCVDSKGRRRKNTNSVISKLVYASVHMQKWIPGFIWSLNVSLVHQNDDVRTAPLADPPAPTDAAIWPLLTRKLCFSGSKGGDKTNAAVSQNSTRPCISSFMMTPPIGQRNV